MKNSILYILLVAGVVLLSASPGDADKPSPVVADLILVNGKIWTVNKAQPEVQALAVWRERILAVGKDADIRQLSGPKTRILDLKGRRVLPGFHDSHVHFLSSG